MLRKAESADQEQAQGLCGASRQEFEQVHKIKNTSSRIRPPRAKLDGRLELEFNVREEGKGNHDIGAGIQMRDLWNRDQQSKALVRHSVRRDRTHSAKMECASRC